MRRLVGMLALCGCASGQSNPQDASPRASAMVTTTEHAMNIGERARASQGTVAAVPGAVWLAAETVFKDYDIPVTVNNPGARQIGNSNFYKSRQVAGRPMAQLVNCGTGIDGPKASSYRVYMSLLATIASNGKGGTDVEITLVATGQDMATNSDRVPCGTTGVLEADMLQRLAAAIAKR